jgi:catechol 2,3-dioxygenase-like lactoylglutathione lyase family enzyme
MITGVQDFYYNVTDIDRAVRFYTEGLGMKLVEKSEFWIALDCVGTKIGLHPFDQKLATVPRDSHGAFAGGTLTLKSNQVPEDRDRLMKAGAKILGESDEAWGHMLVFEDPDGNVLKLMNPKYS